jgi:CoA:oxalate CoA-transferase
MHRPLEGTVVLEVSQAVTGPYAAWLLGSMGARVIKVENPAGDLTRAAARRDTGMSVMFALYNGGKESVTLNLKTAKGREIFKELARKVDVVIENLSPGTMDDWGLSYDALSEINPRLIYASVSGFGRDSKYSRAPALDMVIQAMSGIMAATGLPDQPPLMSGILLIDTLVSPYVVAGVLASLYMRERTGKGERIEIAMRDAAACIPFNLYNVYYDTGRVPPRWGNVMAGYCPGNLYRATDGWIYIACNSDKQAKTLFALMDRQDLVEAEQFGNRMGRWANRKEIDGIVEEWTQTRSKREIFDLLTAAGVPSGMVMDVEEVLNDEDLNARGVFTEVEQPGLGIVKLPRSPIVFASQPAGVEASPALGEHNAQVYGEFLGYDEERLRGLAGEGVIANPPGGLSDGL